MAEHNAVGVSSAFEILLEEMEAHVSLINRVVAESANKGEYDAAKEAISEAEKITNLRNKLSDLRDEWDQYQVEQTPQKGPEKGDRVSKRSLGRLSKGLCTNERAFYLAILQALSELGGSGKLREVLDRVGELMKKGLKQVDYEPLPSDPDTIRWRNTAQWARHSLVKKGLLKGDSPHGTWEITSDGRRYLKDHM
jgi:restriction system protein